MNFSDVPFDLLLTIASLLDVRDVNALSCTCKHLNAVLQEKHFWFSLCHQLDILFPWEQELDARALRNICGSRSRTCGLPFDPATAQEFLQCAAFDISYVERTSGGPLAYIQRTDGTVCLHGSTCQPLIDLSVAQLSVCGHNWAAVTRSGQLFTGCDSSNSRVQHTAFRTAQHVACGFNGALVVTRKNNIYFVPRGDAPTQFAVCESRAVPPCLSSPFEAQDVVAVSSSGGVFVLVGARGALAVLSHDTVLYRCFRVREPIRMAYMLQSGFVAALTTRGRVLFVSPHPDSEQPFLYPAYSSMLSPAADLAVSGQQLYVLRRNGDVWRTNFHVDTAPEQLFNATTSPYRVKKLACCAQGWLALAQKRAPAAPQES